MSEDEQNGQMPEEQELVEDAAELTGEEMERFEELPELEEEPQEVKDDIQAAAEEEAGVASAYKIVDLRGRFFPADSNWGNSSKGRGCVIHYNGGPTPDRAWQQPVDWIRFIAGLHMETGRFAPGWRLNGIAYTEWVVFDTVYRLRNYGADLPHAGNLDWNRNALALHVPVGGSQQPAASTLRALFARTTDHLRAMGLGRARCVGHQEVGSSACPGSPLMQAIRQYRAGQNPGGGGGNPSPPPPKEGRKTRYEFCQDDSGAPGILTWEGRDAWRVTRISHGQHRGARRMDRGAWCRDNRAPAPVVLTWQGRDGWYVERLKA